MADELTQSGFDDTIQKLSAEVEAAGDGVERSIEDQTVVLERILARSVKAITSTLTNSTRLIEQIVETQQTVQDDDMEQDKKSIFLLTNLGISLRGLLTLGVNAKLSDTERTREEKRTSDALIGALSEIGAGLAFLKNKLGDFLKIVSNPLTLIGAVVGIAIGTVAGFFAFFSRALNFPLLLQTLLKPLRALLDPKSRTGKAVTGIAKALGRIIRSFVRVFGRFGAFIVKSIPLVGKIVTFIKPFIKFGKVLGGLLGKLALPLTIVISIVKAVLGFMDEFKKTGSIVMASMRAIGDVLDFLTFGLLNADQLKKFLGKPIQDFISGIKELFAEGFSVATVNKIMEPLIKFMLATPNILIAAVGKLTAFIVEKLGFENFADKMRAFLADFELFDFINDAAQAIGDWFVSLPEKLGQLGMIQKMSNGLVSMFTKITDMIFDFVLAVLPDFVLSKELEQVKQARKIQKDRLEKLNAVQEELGLATLKEADAELKRRAAITSEQKRLDANIQAVDAGARRGMSQAELDALVERRQAISERLKKLKAQTPASLDKLALEKGAASAIELANQMAANATLRDKANQTAPVLLPVPAAPISAGNEIQPMPIPIPLSMRNNENTFRRIMQKDFSGTQG